MEHHRRVRSVEVSVVIELAATEKARNRQNGQAGTDSLTGELPVKPMPSRVASKTYGTVSVDKQRQMSGLEFVQGLVDGSLPLNPMAKTLGYDITEAEIGRVVISAEPNETHLNPAGGVHGGLSATLLDSCMGLAIQSTLEKGVGSTTLEFKISLVRPITPDI